MNVRIRLHVYFRPRTAIGTCVDDFQAYAVPGCKP